MFFENIARDLNFNPVWGYFEDGLKRIYNPDSAFRRSFFVLAEGGGKFPQGKKMQQETFAWRGSFKQKFFFSKDEGRIQVLALAKKTMDFEGAQNFYEGKGQIYQIFFL
ncbi:MAG: hypothetical protein CM15mP51_23320 [Porticoccaceae bacterium]|nr:MAG: hypothetical protein CM15mP51_23320 [Porticoccaceae bacterium]